MNRKKLLAGVLLYFLGVWNAPAFATFADAMENFQLERYPAAYAEFSRLAVLGHKDSQFNLGAMHYRGHSVVKNQVEAYAWIALSAEPDDKNRSAVAERLLEKMSEPNRALAHARAGELLSLYSERTLLKKVTPEYVANDAGTYVLQPLEKKTPKYPLAASRIGLSGSVDVEFSVDVNGNVKNYFILASTNKVFDKVVLDTVKKWRYHPLIKDGSAIAVAGVRTRIHFRMDSDEFNGEKLKEYIADLRYKAESGSAVDTFTYAYIVDMIPEVELEWAEINRWYFKAAQAGLPHAQYELGLNLTYGRGCIRDPIKALEWLTRSANLQHAPAQVFLAAELMSGRHFSSDPEQAWTWLELAVKSQAPEAMVKKAWLLATSKDETRRDGEQALALINTVVDEYPDQFTAYQTLAASQAAAGKFSAAQKTQRKVLKMASRLDFPLEIERERLLAYKKNTPWQE